MTVVGPATDGTLPPCRELPPAVTMTVGLPLPCGGFSALVVAPVSSALVGTTTVFVRVRVHGPVTVNVVALLTE